MAVDDVAELERQVAGALSALTPKQKSRALARLEGKSLGEIAAAEGASKSAVAETLASKPVRATVTILGQYMSVRRSDGEETNLFCELLTNLSEIALSAKKAIVVGDRVDMVPDLRLRYDASVKLLSMIDPPATASPLPVVEAERSVTTTERVVLTPHDTRTKRPRTGR